jgi:hypothetical protein
VTSRRILVLVLGCVVALFGTHAAWAAPLFNSAEPGCNGSDANVLMCDDFERGGQLTASDNQSDPNNNGWLRASSSIVNSTGYLVCGGSGAAGSNCHIRGINHAPDSDAAPHDILAHTHGLAATGLTAIRVRMYVKFDAGYAFNRNHKFQSGQNSAHQGGIQMYGLGADLSQMFLNPAWDNATNFCNTAVTQPANDGVSGKNCNGTCCLTLGQNTNRLVMGTGKWYYLEYRIVLNTPGQRNGVWQMWINDCGTNGICTGTPTLRANYTNVGFRNDSQTIGGYYLDGWGNPADVGTVRVDQIKIVKDNYGLIGFVGGTSTADTKAPSAPTGVTLR